MHSTMQEPPGWDGGTDAEQRLEAALVQVRTVVGDALAAPMLSLRPERLGRLLELHSVDEAMMAALKLAMVARADACDAAKTTGAVSTRVWLRTTQRMSVKDASATVNLARDLDRTVTLTARALGRGDISFRHAQVIAFAIKDLPTWVSPDQLVEAEKFLIAESKRRNPDDVRVLGRHLLQAIAPEEWERRLGEQLAREEAAAERKRSLCFMANGIPGSETVMIKLPVVEMEQLRKIIEALVAADTRPDDRPLDEKRGDVFADLVTQWAQQQASPNRGRGRDCVTVLIHLHQLMNGIGFGTIDDLNPVRPMPCGCQTPDAKRQNAKRKAREHTKRNKSSASEGRRSSTTPCDTTDAGPGERAGDGESVKPDKAETTKPGRNPGSTGAATSEDAEPSSNGEPGNANRSENADDTGTDAQPGRAVTDPDDPTGTGEGAVPTGTSAPEAAPTAAETTATAREHEPDNEKPPADQPDPPAGVAERIPAPREPGQHPQPNTATGIQPESGTEPDPETEPGPGSDPGPDTGPGDCDLGAEDDDAEPEEGAAGPEAALDPHDGCSKCGGGGSARITGLRGEPLSVATIRRMACDANIIPVVLGGDGEVLDVGMADRFFTEAQRRALAVRDGSHCHFPGCQVPERRCVAHHMTAWDDFGPTDLANGVLLCRSHHTFVHHKGWTVRMGDHGHPEYIPPEWVDVRQRIIRP